MPIESLRWLSKAKAEDWQDWHRLCVLLIDFVHPTSEVSYLSMKKVGSLTPPPALEPSRTMR